MLNSTKKVLGPDSFKKIGNRGVSYADAGGRKIIKQKLSMSNRCKMGRVRSGGSRPVQNDQLCLPEALESILTKNSKKEHGKT